MPVLPKQELRQLVAVACTDDALRQLLDLLAGASAHSKVYRAMNLLSGQWQELDEQVRLNLLPFKEAATHRARINAAVLEYIDELPDEIAAPKGQVSVSEIALRQSVQSLAADTDWEYDLFFSFSSKNLDAARAFCYVLRGYGLRVFFSPDDLRLRGGHSFGAVIEQALSRSRHFLLFCTPDAMQSEWVKLEHDTFFQQYHLADRSRRSFYIAEGPGFHADLVPAFYRRYQRVQDAETLLHTFSEHKSVPTVATPPAETPAPPVSKTNSADEASWKIACKTNTIAAYQGYLEKWPNGNYTNHAFDQIDDLKNDQALWDYLAEHSTPLTLEDNLRAYLEAYPGGLHFRDARSRLGSIERKRATANEKRQKKLELEAQQRQAAEASRQKRQVEAAVQERREEAPPRQKRKSESAEKMRRDAKPDPQKRRDAEAILPEMIFVKGGTFRMGEKDVAEPVHTVAISDFEIGKYPVTQKLWKEIMGHNPSHFKGCDDCPVEEVSWDDTQRFLEKLNIRFAGKNYRLPTEAEWEFAARGGINSKGFKYAGSNVLNDVGWFDENAGDRTHPIGRKMPNEIGIYDLSGNVWEWCADYYGEYPKSDQINPTGPIKDVIGPQWLLFPITGIPKHLTISDNRILRGGSWSNSYVKAKLSNRFYSGQSLRQNGFGLRLARSIDNI